MPELVTYTAIITVKVEVAGNNFHEAARRAEQLVQPACQQDAPGHVLPCIRSACITDVTVSRSGKEGRRDRR